jgi:tRNA nucleotidyltransferase (CCA-adding enzyme)
MGEVLDFSNISPHIHCLLQEIGRFGEETHRPVYVVGGFVRDLLIERENLDIDIVVEGDAVDFACQLAKMWEGQVQLHHQFKTAAITRSDGLKLDFVSARNETYPSPGALPSVEYGTIVEDLLRRDFSINALAIQLRPDTFGELVDCTDGLRDLRTGHIRTLHKRSFVDDPTRIFRAIRYEGRYNFQLTESDQKQMLDAIKQGVLNLISGQRIRNEIDHILSEEAAPQMVNRMSDFDLLGAIHPTWKIPPNFDVRWTAAGQAIEWASTSLPNDPINTGAIFWMTLLTSPEAIEGVNSRLALENQLYAKLSAQAQLEHDLNALSTSSKPSEVYQLLNPYPLEPLVFGMMQSNQPDWRVRKIGDYLTNLRSVQPLVTGEDLIQRGLKPSRAFSDLLWKAFAAQLNGQVSTTQETYQLLDIEK